MPGTEVGKKVALYEKITRADLAVLLAEELKISKLIERKNNPIYWLSDTCPDAGRSFGSRITFRQQRTLG